MASLLNWKGLNFEHESRTFGNSPLQHDPEAIVFGNSVRYNEWKETSLDKTTQPQDLDSPDKIARS